MDMSIRQGVFPGNFFSVPFIPFYGYMCLTALPPRWLKEQQYKSLYIPYKPKIFAPDSLDRADGHTVDMRPRRYECILVCITLYSMYG
jgi:hypothetical protein